MTGDFKGPGNGSSDNNAASSNDGSAEAQEAVGEGEEIRLTRNGSALDAAPLFSRHLASSLALSHDLASLRAGTSRGVG